MQEKAKQRRNSLGAEIIDPKPKTSPEERQLAKERGRLLHQMVGGKTCDLSPAELGHLMTLKKEKEAQLKELNTSTHHTPNNEDEKMRELLSDPPSLKHLKDV